MEIGISTFVENTPNPTTGELLSPHIRMQNLMEEIKLADEVGLDLFAVGEHHRQDYLVSSPTTILAAAASITKNIRLSSAVTVLGSEDPVRVFQQFAHIDIISGGRAEIMAGRGSFIESFPLFGIDLDHYDDIFAENLDLLIQLNKSEIINWKGKFRAPIENRGVYPRPHQKEIPIWLAVGGTPESVVRAAKKGLPLTIAIIGGMPERFKQLTDLYRQVWLESGRDEKDIQIAVNAHGFVGDNTAQVANDYFLPYTNMMGKIGKERGWPPMTREQYEAMRSMRGSLLVGDPQLVIDKILMQQEIMGLTRYELQMSVGTVPHDQMMRSIELLGTVVAPAVKKAVS